MKTSQLLLRAALLPALFLLRTVPAAAAANLKNPSGTTEGMVVSSPEWSVGAQVGNGAATGLVAQKAGFYNGALNVGLGLDDGSLSLHADYILIMTEDFRLLSLSKPGAYNSFRGKLNPYFGGGLQVGDGAALRAPVGLQYTMLRDPINYFGGLALMVGPFFSDDDAGLQLWFNLGIRVLL